MKRTEIRGGGWLRRVTPLLPGSSRQRRAADRRTADFSPAAKAAMKARAGGRCEWWSGCTERDTDNAHREKRSTLNGNASNGVRLCRAHHDWCHSNPVKARNLAGLILLAGTDYRRAPVRIRQSHGCWVLLADDGSFSPWEPEL